MLKNLFSNGGYSGPPLPVSLALHDTASHIEQVYADAARYRFIRAEHSKDLPLCAVVFKRGLTRNQADWVNASPDLDAAIDRARVHADRVTVSLSRSDLEHLAACAGVNSVDNKSTAELVEAVQKGGAQ